VLTITRHGASFTPSQDAVAEFARPHSLLLPELLEPDLLAFVQSSLSRAEFDVRVHEGIGAEHTVPPGPLTGVLELLLNDAGVLDAIETLTRCAPLRCFDGRISRLDGAAGDADSWHDDVTQDRRVALSLNLGAEPYDGGALLLRDRRTSRVVAERRNTGLGDAVIFRIAPYLEHVVTKVRGSVPRTAYVGWFRSSPDYRDLLRERLAGATAHPAA
jgi:hypothetical protein